ncbi:putative permease [Oribacterium sp. oral taxon 078 str. F0262]|uniref:NCS2 family permease n=1 Tax=Oribacterium sp. oral taxon 078 TaxID=652706 RepID=UPI0001BCB819|nr:NCS2 family permease [Oribacterium sp. oral taxon 078]EFE90634.1 putative permease [Oribacterium sp. oral taxon 078 str. F0262]
MEKFFKLKENKTDVKTELIAGVTTFMTMAYILAVNPSILKETGMDAGAVFTATALASALASFCMALLANLPFVLSAGMGLNAYFAYTVVMGMGYSWEVALAAVFVEGLIFIVLSVTNVREAIFNAIPKTLKIAVSVGIGLFITFIGLQNAHIVVDGATLVTMFSFHGALTGGTFHTEGITVLLALIGTMITAFLVLKNVKGNILLGILITWLLGVLCELSGLYVPDPELKFFSLIPSGILSMPSSLAPTLLKMDFSGLLSLNFLVVVFAFLFVDIFDTLGTLIGCASKANMLDQDGKLPGIKGALFADAIGTTAGACLGTSTITTFVESSSGIAEGGRTGLTAVVAGALFALSLFFSPIFLAIPSFATAPALIIVGFFMMQQVAKIDWEDALCTIPAFICICAMAFMYSISEGIAFGIISYSLLHLLMGKGKEVTPLMYVLSIVFILKYVFL